MKKIKIEVNGPILTGSISTAMAKCSNRNCKCRANPPTLHGPYFRWTGIQNGKRTTVTLSENEAKECQKRISNYKLLKKEIDKLIAHAFAQAPWNLRS